MVYVTCVQQFSDCWGISEYSTHLFHLKNKSHGLSMWNNLLSFHLSFSKKYVSPTCTTTRQLYCFIFKLFSPLLFFPYSLLIAWQTKYREDRAIWLTVMNGGRGRSWKRKMWLKAKFQRETESLAFSYLQSKIKLQKPLVESLHTFSTIGMVDRNSIYFS